MKTILIVLLILLFAALANAGSKKDLVEHFKSNAEPTAKDAAWTSSNVFAVGVFDNGTDRRGYAEYVCSIMPDFGINPGGTMVKIIDIAELNKTGKWKTLGKTYCK